MTIWLYSGTPGSGKSLHATRDIYECVRYKRLPVVCNYELSFDSCPRADASLFHYVENQELSPAFLVGFADEFWRSGAARFGEDRILLVIDECQLLFNSRNWQDEGRMAWLSFFSQHRKYGYRVILVAQSDGMVDRQFRALFEYNVVHRKLGNFGFAGRMLSGLLGGRTCFAVTSYYGTKQRLGVSMVHVRRRITSLYDSYGTFAAARRGMGVPAARPRRDARATARRKPERISGA